MISRSLASGLEAHQKMKRRGDDAIYLAPSLPSNRYAIFNPKVVSRAEIFELATAIPWDVGASGRACLSLSC